jgi:hypothetical protein
VRWRQVAAVLDVVLELAPPERDAYQAAACGGDAALRAEVEELLAADEASGEFLEAPSSVHAQRHGEPRGGAE